MEKNVRQLQRKGKGWLAKIQEGYKNKKAAKV